MEIVAVLFVVLFAFIILKILGFFLHAGVFVLTLPFKILGVVFSVLLFGLVLIPLGIVGLLVGVVLVPLSLLVFLSPFILVVIGLYLILKKS